MRNDAGWTTRAGKQAAQPKKIDDVVLPFLEKELGITPDMLVRDNPQYDSGAESIVRQAMAEAAKTYLLSSDHASPLAEKMIGGSGRSTLLFSAVTEYVGKKDRIMRDDAMDKAGEIVQRLQTEVKSGLGLGRGKTE